MDLVSQRLIGFIEADVKRREETDMSVVVP